MKTFTVHFTCPGCGGTLARHKRLSPTFSKDLYAPGDLVPAELVGEFSGPIKCHVCGLCFEARTMLIGDGVPDPVLAEAVPRKPKRKKLLRQIRELELDNASLRRRLAAMKEDRDLLQERYEPEAAALRKARERLEAALDERAVKAMLFGDGTSTEIRGLLPEGCTPATPEEIADSIREL